MGGQPPGSVIFGCAGLQLSIDERALFRAIRPPGLIVFERNCSSPDQLRALVDDFRDCVDDETALVLIDQEGGRVSRLKPPHWRHPPPSGVFANLARSNPEAAVEATELNARLIATELFNLSINVDCTPVLDLPEDNADPIIGDRAFGTTPEQVIRLGEAVCNGMLDGGVLPVIKHAPGHGRAGVDSHKALPVVEADQKDLTGHDFTPFGALAHMPLAMTAHVVYTAFDQDHPATTSSLIIQDIIRGHIGFDGWLISDDLSMDALRGDLSARANAALSAGCDVALHCNGRLDEMSQIATHTPHLSASSLRRLQIAKECLKAPQAFDNDAALSRLDELLNH